MLNEENKSRKITTRCIDCLPVVYIACPQDNCGIKVIMAPITEEQEITLNNEDLITIKDQYDNSFIVNPKACYAYGALDLSPKSDDMDKIIKANWFKYMHISIDMVTKYDYETHTVTSDVVGGRWYETDNIALYLPFLYAKLGKPERVVIFRDEVNFIKLKKLNKAKNSKLNKKHYITCNDYYKSYNKNKAAIKRQQKISNLSFKIKK